MKFFLTFFLSFLSVYLIFGQSSVSKIDINISSEVGYLSSSFGQTKMNLSFDTNSIVGGYIPDRCNGGVLYIKFPFFENWFPLYKHSLTKRIGVRDCKVFQHENYDFYLNLFDLYVQEESILDYLNSPTEVKLRFRLNVITPNSLMVDTLFSNELVFEIPKVSQEDKDAFDFIMSQLDTKEYGFQYLFTNNVYELKYPANDFIQDYPNSVFTRYFELKKMLELKRSIRHHSNASVTDEIANLSDKLKNYNDSHIDFLME